MKLLIDIGNSSVVIANYLDQLSDIKVVATNNFIDMIPTLNINRYERVIICSVVPKIDQHLKTLPGNLIFITHQNIPIIQLNVNQPSEVGADRLVTAVAAYKKTKQSCLIIDSGTAITFCYVNNNGIYQGGAIFPGMRIASQALNTHTAKIPLIYVDPQTTLYGKNTKEAVQIGLYSGYIQLINGMINQYKQLDPTLTVIGTGKGLAVLLDQLNIDTYNPHLILDGLKYCADALKNQGELK